MGEKRFKLSEIYSDTIMDTENCINNGSHCRMYDIKEVVDLLNKLIKDNEELGISIKLFEDDIATKDKKIDEQQDTIRKLRNENIIMKNKIEDLRFSLFMQDQVLQRQMQKSDLDE